MAATSQKPGLHLPEFNLSRSVTSVQKQALWIEVKSDSSFASKTNSHLYNHFPPNDVKSGQKNKIKRWPRRREDVMSEVKRSTWRRGVQTSGLITCLLTSLQLVGSSHVTWRGGIYHTNRRTVCVLEIIPDRAADRWNHVQDSLRTTDSVMLRTQIPLLQVYYVFPVGSTWWFLLLQRLKMCSHAEGKSGKMYCILHILSPLHLWPTVTSPVGISVPL